MKPTISIIVPVYNVEKYLRKCLDSILQQSFRDYELILVDDGSKDSSPLICDEYAAKDHRIKVIHKVNGGLSSARNAGLETASGKYIAFIDSDDWIALDMLEILHDNIVRYQADISQCKTIRTKSDRELEYGGSRKSVSKVYSNLFVLGKLHATNDINYAIVCNKLYKADLLRKIRFPEGKIHEDEFVNYKLIYGAKRIVCTNDKLYIYRQRADSIMNRKFSLSRLDGLEALLQRKEFYKRRKHKKLYQEELLYLLEYIPWMTSQVKTKIKDNKKVLRYLKKNYRKTVMELMLSGYRDKEFISYLMDCIIPD